MFRVIGVVLLLMIAGCGTAPSAEDTVRAEFGRQIHIRSSGSPVLATLWVDGVEPITCTEPGSLPPNRGHYLAVRIVLQTTEQYEPDWGWWMSAEDFHAIDGDGEVIGQGLVTSCLSPSRYLLDDFYLTDSGYYGEILVDAAAEHGTLVYRPHNLPSDINGWHWQF